MDINRLSEITRCNLDLYRASENRIAVGTKAHISVLCRHFCRQSFADTDEARQYYNRLMSELKASEKERRIFCSLLYDMAKEENAQFILSAYTTAKPKKNASVIYMRNPLCDIAYDRFCHCFSTLSAEYEVSFADCAARLYSDDCDYIILPVANDEGRLHSFCRLIDRYELHPVLCTTVHDEVNDTESVFAVVSKSIESFDGKSRELLDISVSNSQSSFAKVIEFANTEGLLPYSADTLGASLSEARAEIVFDVSEKNIYPFLTYAFFEIPRHIIIGIYKEI